MHSSGRQVQTCFLLWYTNCEKSNLGVPDPDWGSQLGNLEEAVVSITIFAMFAVRIGTLLILIRSEMGVGYADLFRC
jgi:hypothetical protein